MSVTEEHPSRRFTQHYQESYPPEMTFNVGRKNRPHIGTSALQFRKSRAELLENFFYSRPKQAELIQSYFAEQIINLALRPLIAGAGFSSQLAPQSLEHGEGQKGVDLLITDPQQRVYLGIDVKLRKGHIAYKRDGFGWSQHIRAPHIFLALGDWEPEPHQDEHPVTVKKWLKQHSKEGIYKNGQIPNLPSLRAYVTGRIERTLEHAHEAVREPQIFPYSDMLPAGTRDIAIMREKIGVMHHLFASLRGAA